MSSFILAIDQGTTSSRAVLYNAETLKPLLAAGKELPQIYPQPGWVEHDPELIWHTVVESIQKLLGKGTTLKEFSAKEISCIGITNQRETVVAWNRKTGELAGHALVWQDRRTADFCDSLKNDPKTKSEIHKKTGLVCDPYFSASKMRWMLQNFPKAAQFAKNGELLFGTVDSYLIYRLTNGKSCVTEHTNASRTMLYNIGNGTYDADLCTLFGVTKDSLPTILPSSGTFGTTEGVPGLPDGIPITGCLGDQQAALFGHGFTEKGEGKITFGTGAFLLISTGSEPFFSSDGILSTVAYASAESRTFALEGSAFIAGAAVQFLRDNFGWFERSPDSDRLALQDPRDNELFFVPALAGLGAPYWNPHAKGTLFGLTRGTSRSQITRAVLESIALQNVLLLNLMSKAMNEPIRRLGVDGGAARSDLLMQFQSDAARVQLIRPDDIEVTAKGAAAAALIGLTKISSKVQSSTQKEFVPEMPKSDAESIVSRWLQAAEAVNRFYA